MTTEESSPELLILKINELLKSLDDQQTATLFTLLNHPDSDTFLRIVVNTICNTILANTLKQRQGSDASLGD
jgi:hypothetical protein